MGLTTVDALRRSATVGRTSGIAFRQRRSAVPELVVDPLDMRPAVDYLLARIEGISKSRDCGAYLFVDPKTKQAYVVNEERSIAQAWLRERRGWFVGCYRVSRAGEPTAEGLCGDLAEHLGVS